MADYRIFTDSTTDLPAALADELELIVLPLSFTVNGKTYHNYLDGREMTARAFYDHIRAGAMPTTSQINPDTFVEAFTPVLKAGEDVLYLAFSSGLSGTCQSAKIAAEQLREEFPDRKIVVIDTLCASLGEGLFAYYCAKKKQAGASFDELAAWAEENKLHLCHWFTVNDLHHLKRGGRVSAAAAVFGTMLNIKPVLHVDNAGHLIPVSKVRGRRQSIDALLHKMEELVTNPEEQVIFISHSDCFDEAEGLGEAIRKKMHVKDVVINDIGPVIGSHTGCGTIALFFMGKER